MTPPRHIIGTVSQLTVRWPWRRRIVAAALVLLFVILALYPQRYRAVVSMTPTDPSSLGLSGTLGEFGAVNSVFGTQTAVEVMIRVATGVYARQAVIDRLDLIHRLGLSNSIQAQRWLERNVTVRTLRGGLVTIETSSHDPELGRRIVSALADATRDQLAEIGKRQTAYKRQVLTRLLAESEVKMDEAQREYDAFRYKSGYAQPSSAISIIGSRVTVLRETLRSKQVQLNVARKFATDENMGVRQIQAEMEVLRSQLREAESQNPGQPDSLNDVVVKSTQIRELERKLGLARSLHDNYERYLQGTSVEDATQAAVVRILERPFVDPARQINLTPAILALLIAALALAIEFYQWRPPVGQPLVQSR